MDRQVYDRMRGLEDRHWWFRARRDILSDQIGRLGLPAGASVLEVGCGTGGNLGMLGRFGAVTGMEPDDQARGFAAEKSGVPVESGLLPDGLPFKPGQFDLVAALDVIEHVDDDAGSVKALARLLKPGGFMITTVPAYAWMWSHHDELHHHKRRYGLSAYRHLFDEAGLTVRKASYFNTALFAPIALVRLIKLVLRIKGADEDSMPGPAINGLFRGLFAGERLWLRGAGFPFGVSILLIAERPA
jgi:SAM-dependent methyltransferase